MVRHILFVIVVFLSCIIQAGSGFAGTILAMPPSIKLEGFNNARVVLNVIGILSCTMVLIKDYHYVKVKETLKMAVIMAMGIILGQIVVQLTAVDVLLSAYGVFIVAIAFNNIVKGAPNSYSELVGSTLILMAGVIHGIFISGGSLLVLYATGKFDNKLEFRASMSVLWILLNGLLVFFHMQQGYFSKLNIVLICVCAVLTYGAVQAGTYIHRKVNENMFLIFVNILLILSGVMLVMN